MPRPAAALAALSLTLTACTSRVEISSATNLGTLDAGPPPADGGPLPDAGPAVDAGTSTDGGISPALATLTVVLAGSAGIVESDPPGIACANFIGMGPPSVCAAAFPLGAQVSLEARAALGTFLGWSGGGCESAGAGGCTLVLTGDTTVTADLTEWVVRLPFPSAVSALALFDGTLVAAGPGGAVVSADGIAWTAQDGFFGASQLASSDAALVAVAEGRLCTVAQIERTSAQVSWSADACTDESQLEGVAYGGGLFVAAGAQGALLVSADGTSWTPAASPTSAELRAVAASGSGFVAVGEGALLSSPDGVSWTSRVLPGVAPSLFAAAHGDAGFVAVGADGAVLFSPDGAAWSASPALTSATLRGVASSGPLFVAAGDALSANGSALAFTSTDGQTWSAQETGLAQETVLGVAWAGGDFYLLGASGSILSSPDGRSWSVRVTSPGTAAAPLTTLSAIAAGTSGAAGLVAVGARGTLFSADDAYGQWTLRRAEGCCAAFTGVAFGAGQFVAVGSDVFGSGSRVFASPDGAAWSQVATLDAGTLLDVAFAGSFVAVGASLDGGAGLVATSPDGLSWSDVSADAGLGPVVAVGAGGGLFVATGSGAIYTSPDGASWTARVSPTADTLGKVAYGNGLFVAADRTSGAASLTSSDGASWSVHAQSASGPGDPFFEAPCGGVFFSGAWGESLDGIAWSPMPVPAGFTLLSGACALVPDALGGPAPASLVGVAPGEQFEFIPPGPPG